MNSTGYLYESGMLIIISSLWMRKLKPRRAKGLAQGHRDGMHTQQQPSINGLDHRAVLPVLNSHPSGR